MTITAVGGLMPTLFFNIKHLSQTTREVLFWRLIALNLFSGKSATLTTYQASLNELNYVESLKITISLGVELNSGQNYFAKRWLKRLRIFVLTA